jgi:hypothetical protein
MEEQNMLNFEKTFSNILDHNPENIDKYVEERKGVYFLGHYDDITTAFIITYVGRGDLNARLKKHLKDEYKDDKFQFLFTDDESLSCDLECKYYHKYYENLENINHPSLPEKKHCPYCNHVGT